MNTPLRAQCTTRPGIFNLEIARGMGIFAVRPDGRIDARVLGNGTVFWRSKNREPPKIEFNVTEMMHGEIKDRMIGMGSALLAQLLFGTTFALNKWLINVGLDPLELAFHRAWLAMIFLFPFFWRNRHTTRWGRAEWGAAFFVGGVAATLGMALEYLGAKFTLASNVAVIIGTESIFSMVLCVVILGERLPRTTVLAMILALIGVGFVLGEDVRHLEIHFLGTKFWGDLLTLGAVIFWGLYSVLGKRLLRHSHPFFTIFLVTFFNALVLGMIHLVRGNAPTVTALAPLEWLVLVYLGMGCSGLAHLLYFTALHRLPASLVVLTLTLLPVFGVTLAVILLNESLGFLPSCGALLIIIALAYAFWPRPKTEGFAQDLPVGQ